MNDKSRRCEKEVKRIHFNIKKSNKVLRQRMLTIQKELKDWDLLGGLTNEEGFLREGK